MFHNPALCKSPWRQMTPNSVVDERCGIERQFDLMFDRIYRTA
jgi:hypothetical protein